MYSAGCPDGFAIGPTRRGPVGCSVEACGQMDSDAPESSKKQKNVVCVMKKNKNFLLVEKILL
jgi:hypothetical protein